MLKRSALLVAAAIALPVMPSSASAQVSPPIVGSAAQCDAFGSQARALFVVRAGALCWDLSYLVNPDVIPGVQRATALLDMGLGSTMRVNAIWDADPFVQLEFETLGFVDGTEYQALFASPVMETLYSRATSQATVSLTAGPLGSASVTGTASNGLIESSGGNNGAFTSLGVDIGATTCTAAAGTTEECTFGLNQSMFAPRTIDELRALLSYTHTGVGSSATIMGRVDILPEDDGGSGGPGSVVPEPSTYVLMTFGLLALGAVAQRRRRA